jgi:hypothetical protein
VIKNDRKSFPLTQDRIIDDRKECRKVPERLRNAGYPQGKQLLLFIGKGVII